MTRQFLMPRVLLICSSPLLSPSFLFSFFLAFFLFGVFPPPFHSFSFFRPMKIPPCSFLPFSSSSPPSFPPLLPLPPPPPPSPPVDAVEHLDCGLVRQPCDTSQIGRPHNNCRSTRGTIFKACTPA